MKAGWYLFSTIMLIIAILVVLMIGYSLPRPHGDVYVTEDKDTIKIFGVYDYPIIYYKSLNGFEVER